MLNILIFHEIYQNSTILLILFFIKITYNLMNKKLIIKLIQLRIHTIIQMNYILIISFTNFLISDIDFNYNLYNYYNTNL